jgi:hypothetical protein
MRAGGSARGGASPRSGGPYIYLFVSALVPAGRAAGRTAEILSEGANPGYGHKAAKVLTQQAFQSATVHREMLAWLAGCPRLAANLVGTP